jgi:predicted Zn-dependent protease with MMP-like domain
MHISPNRFEQFVVEAEDAVLAQLPPDLAGDAQQVVLIVADYPTRDQIKNLPPGHTLLGLYEGIPLVHRSPNTVLLQPDRITLFRGPITARCATEAEVKTQVHKTLIHELGHYFGFSEAELEARGWA